jgi:O-antigen/teichoic acid export membrane protein
MAVPDRDDARPDDASPVVEPVPSRHALRRIIGRVISDGSLTKKASLNAAASTAEQGARIIAGLLISPFLLTRLGDYAFGIWQFLQRLIGHASPASGRPGEALKWTIAHEQRSDDYDFKRRQVGNALAVSILFLPILALIGGVLAWMAPIWLKVPADLYHTVRLAGGILVVDAMLFSLFYLPQSALQGENLGYKRLGLTVVLVFVSKGFLAVAAYLGAGIPGLAVADLAGTVLWGFAYVYIARSRIGWFGIARPSFAEVRGFVGLSWWFLLWNLVMTVMLASDVVVLGIAGSPTLVTTYTLAKFVPQAIIVAVATIIFAIMPGLGGLVGVGDLTRAIRVRGETMSLVWLFAVATGAAILVWEESFLRLWVGPQYYPGAITMLMIVLSVLQFSLIRVDTNIIDLTLDLRHKTELGAFSAALSVVLGWLFLGPFGWGIMGLVVGFILGRMVQSIGYPFMIGRMLGIPPEHQVRGVVRPALATTVILAAATVLGTVVHAQGWAVLIVGGGVTASAVAVIAFAVGLSASMRSMVWRRLRKVARLA